MHQSLCLNHRLYWVWESKQIQQQFPADHHSADCLSTCAGWQMDNDGGRDKQTLIEMLLYNVMSEVSYSARLKIALGQHFKMQGGSEQNYSAQRI